MHLREDYWADPDARQAFKDFLQQIHNLDLAPWEAAGFWDPAYRPYSLFDDDGRVISSVCLYSLDMVVDGKPMRGAQISGVGTLPAFRRRGLNRELTEKALAWARDTHDFHFLFSDEEAIPFYARCGFERLDEQMPHLRIRPPAQLRTPQRLDMEAASDRALVHDLGVRRAPVSEQLGVLSPKLLMFHAMYPLRELLHYVKSLDAVVAFQRKGDRLAIYEVVAETMPTWEQLAPFVAVPETRHVSFSFCPDQLGVQDIRWERHPDNDLHDRGDIPLRGQAFLFPYTAHA